MMQSTLYVFVHEITGQVKGVALLSRDRLMAHQIEAFAAQGWILQ